MLECKICGFLSESEEEMELHLQTDDRHSDLREQFSLEELTNELDIEELYKETYPKYQKAKYEYPYSKVYTIKVTDNIYANKEKNKFYDKESQAVYSADNLVRFLKLQGRLKELKEFLEWKVKLHLSNIAKVTGVNLRTEDLEKMSKEEVLARMFREYFSNKDKRVRLGRLVLDNQRKTKEFLSGEATVCPYCNMLIENTFLSKHFEAKKICEQLGVQFKDKKFLETLSKKGFSASYRGEFVWIPLSTMIHLALEHEERLSRMLGKELRLKNQNAENYFKARRWEHKGKKTKISLSDLEVPKLEERLTKGEKAFLSWLKKRD